MIKVRMSLTYSIPRQSDGVDRISSVGEFYAHDPLMFGSEFRRMLKEVSQSLASLDIHSLAWENLGISLSGAPMEVVSQRPASPSF